MSHGLDSGSIIGEVTLRTHASPRFYKKLRLAWKNRSDLNSREVVRRADSNRWHGKFRTTSQEAFLVARLHSNEFEHKEICGSWVCF
jgi:hypothetical protein